jgi:hypothetical protein
MEYNVSTRMATVSALLESDNHGTAPLLHPYTAEPIRPGSGAAPRAPPMGKVDRHGLPSSHFSHNHDCAQLELLSHFPHARPQTTTGCSTACQSIARLLASVATSGLARRSTSQRAGIMRCSLGTTQSSVRTRRSTTGLPTSAPPLRIRIRSTNRQVDSTVATRSPVSQRQPVEGRRRPKGRPKGRGGRHDCNVDRNVPIV